MIRGISGINKSFINNLNRYFLKTVHKHESKNERKNYLDQWVIYFGWQTVLEEDPKRMYVLQPPSDRFYADPFPISIGGRHYIFFEEYVFGAPPGFISVAEVFTDGTHLPPVPVIQTGYHLSYPFLFEVDGQLLMIPESSHNRTIEVWSCLQFPFKWQKMCNLLENVLAADTSPLFHDDRWWLFTSMGGGSNKIGDNLCLFHCEDFFGGKWLAHDRNPVRKGIAYERPGGNFILRGGSIIRPVQDSLKCYGWALEFREIIELNSSRYAERSVKRIEPDWDSSLRRTHTYSHHGDLLAMDAVRLVPKSKL